MKSVANFNALNGARFVKREDIEAVILTAEKDEQTHVVSRLQSILNDYPENKYFNIQLTTPAVEIIPNSIINCLDCEESQDDENGLNKGVSTNDIYQMITDKMIQLIKDANSGDWKQSWNGKFYGKGYMIPYNFESKKRYRGVNVFLLTDGFGLLENPFFLTFKQIENLKGTLKKGSKGRPVVYFTKLYKVEDRKRDIDFGTYDKAKAIDFALSNGIDENKITYLPILKYYNLFNGADIEGIDFDLDNFKIGYIDIDLPADEENRLPIAEAIITNYPKPQPKLKFGGNDAVYKPGFDLVQMPYLTDFDTVQDYYRTLFHEFSHSTGNYNRLNRDFSGKFGSKKYAFEELVAEWGAVFLSAEAGIIWYSNKNHASYIKGWNSVLTQLKEDNKFIMRACTKAQELCDFVLQPDQDGEPLYLKNTDFSKLVKIEKVEKKAPRKQKAKKPVKVVAKKEIQKVEKPIEIIKEKEETKKPFVNQRKPKKPKKAGDQYALFGLKKTGLKSPIEKIDTSKELSELMKLGFVSANDVPEKADNLYFLPGNIGEFLQEQQPHKSLIIIKGNKHSSKSQLAMQIANAYGEMGEQVAYIDYEQGGLECKDTVDSVNRNTTEKGKKNIAIIGYLEDPFNDLQKFCKVCKVIIADSVTDLKITADQLNELRNKYIDVTWIFISQVKENGEMYGGNKMAHNPTVIIDCSSSKNPEERIATLVKNRGNKLELRYSIFYKKVIETEPIDEPKTEVQPAEAIEFSFNVK